MPNVNPLRDRHQAARCSRCGIGIISGNTAGFCPSCTLADADAYRLQRAAEIIREFKAKPEVANG